MYQNPPPPPPERRTPALILAVVAGAIVLVTSIVLALVLMPKKDAIPSAESSTPAVTTTNGATTTDDETTTTTTSTTSSTTSSSSTTSERPDPPIAGADWQGFTDGSARCNASEDAAVFIGETARSRVVVCQVGDAGGLYYKGYAESGQSEVDIASSGSGSYVTRYRGDVRYAVTPSALVISVGDTDQTEPWLESWNR